MLNFPVATLQKEKNKQIGEINFSVFYLIQFSQNIATQPINSIKIMRKFSFSFSYHAFKIQGAFYFSDTSHLGLAPLAGFESQVWPGPRILGSAG